MQTEEIKGTCSCGFLDIRTISEREQSEISTSKIIQGACRVPSSLFTMTKASMNVATNYQEEEGLWSGSNNKNKYFKHGSYDRYLARLKGMGPLTTQPYKAGTQPLQGNKKRMIGLMPMCRCQNNSSS